MNYETQKKNHAGYILIMTTMSGERFYAGKKKVMTKALPATEFLFETVEEARAFDRELQRRWAQPGFCGLSCFVSIHEVVQKGQKRKVCHEEV
jgi:hypothetical protein